MRSEYATADTGRRKEITQWIQQTNGLDLESLVDDYLEPQNNPEIANPDIPADGPEVPELLQLSSFELLSRLARLHSGYRVTLNLTNLKVEEVLELVYDCQGMITRLEIFNLKDYAAGKTAHIADISRLMQAINEGSAIHLKQVIREIIGRLNHDTSNKSPPMSINSQQFCTTSIRSNPFTAADLSKRVSAVIPPDDPPGFTAWGWPLEKPCPKEPRNRSSGTGSRMCAKSFPSR